MTKQAVIHVENSEGIIDFAKFLANSGWTLLSANKTENLLKQEKIPVITEPALSENNIYLNEGASLVKRVISSKYEDETSFEGSSYNISNKEDCIYLICMNLNPTAVSVKNRSIVPLNFFISTVIRNAFINSENVLILTDPADYKEAIIQLKTDNITAEFRTYLAAKALNMISAYDGGIASSYLMHGSSSLNFMEYLTIPFKKTQNLHGGANIQQDACLYTYPLSANSMNGFRKLQGKELNYNIISDISLAWELISLLNENLKNQLTVRSTNCDGYNFTTQFTPITGTVCTVMIKFKSIIGASISSNVHDSFIKTNACNADIIHNATIASSAVIDESAASQIVKYDFAAIVAPGFTSEAKEIFSQNKKLRLIPTTNITVADFDMQLINDGLLFQTKDKLLFNHWDVKTKLRPSQYITDQMAFGTVLAMGSRTYCAVLLKDYAIAGISQASKSAVKAVELATNDMNSNNHEADLLICDTTVPLCEPIKALIDQGITAIIQTGGSANDEELIKYCDEHNVILVFTGMAHISY